MKSTHQAIVVPIKLENHPNADALSLVQVDGYQVVVRTADWVGKNIGVFIPPENCVDTERDEFKFLHKNKKWEKIKPVRLRGQVSTGLLVPAPEGSNIGDDVTNTLGIIHQDDESVFEKKTEGIIGGPPNIVSEKYDIDALLKFYKEFEEGEPVIVTEKIHGANWRALYSSSEEKFYVGSRTNWWEESDNNMFWKGFHSNSNIANWLKDHPDFTLRGEIYGMNKHYHYGIPQGEYRVAIFDIQDPNGVYKDYDWFSHECLVCDIDTVPFVGDYSFFLPKMKELAEGDSLWPNESPREGVVVRPIRERKTSSGDRLILKIIGEGYKG